MTYFGIAPSAQAHRYMSNFYDKTLYVRLSFEDRVKHRKVTGFRFSDKMKKLVTELDKYTLTTSIH